MPQTVILVDLENVQLQVDDLRGLVRGEHQLRIFHGPSQNKLTMDLVRALQPLGDAVAYIQCEKAGPNALDFHLAFHLGRLSALQPDDAYVIVSRDKGFAQLVSHGNKLGHHIRQVDRLVIDGHTSSRAAAAKPTAAGKAERAAPAKKAPATKVAAKVATKNTAPAKKAAAAKKAAPVKAETPQAVEAKAPARKAPASKKATATKQPSAPAAKRTASGTEALRSTPSASDISKALASLKRMAPEKRPTKAASLEHHLQSHLRADLSESGVAAVVEALFAQGWIERAAGNKVSYALERR